jgi:hypothetical protein
MNSAAIDMNNIEDIANIYSKCFAILSLAILSSYKLLVTTLITWVGNLGLKNLLRRREYRQEVMIILSISTWIKNKVTARCLHMNSILFLKSLRIKIEAKGIAM